MQIGAVIRKYRKEKNLTQEQMAGYLGVTAPAVNKWESSVSCPDITLLAPIARLLGISTDTLLSFKEDLTREETGRLANQVAEKLQAGEMDAAFANAMSIIREYPNCELLILTIAQILDSYRMIAEREKFEKYEKDITALFERVLNSTDINVKQGAIIAMFNKSLIKEEYEQAQEYLNQIEKQLINPERFQAVLYARQGKSEEAFELYERLMMTGFSELSWALNGLYQLEVGNKDFEAAERIVEKQEKLAELMEMGEYTVSAPRLSLAQDKKDKEAWFEVMEQLIDSLEEMDSFRESNLYRHMKFKQGADAKVRRQYIKTCFEKDIELDFVREDPRFQKLIEKLS